MVADSLEPGQLLTMDLNRRSIDSLVHTGMYMPVDRDGPVSLDVQIRNDLLAKFLSQELVPGDPLPSERELRAQYGVSRTTVRLALRDLTRSGFVYSIPGKGSFVASSVIDPSSTFLGGFTDFSRHEGANASSKVLVQQVILAPHLVASRLKIPENGHVIRLKRLRLWNGVPAALDDSYLPSGLCSAVLERDLERGSLYEMLRDLGLGPVRAEQTMKAGLPDQEEATLLEIGGSLPVIRTERLAFKADGRPIEYAKSTYRSDRYQLNVILGQRGEMAFFQGP
jgi:GntR family transcriptional regulator